MIVGARKADDCVAPAQRAKGRGMCEHSSTDVSDLLTDVQQTIHKRTVQSRETRYSRRVGVVKKRCLGYL